LQGAVTRPMHFHAWRSVGFVPSSDMRESGVALYVFVTNVSHT
jgi:hypothetical protein